MHQVLQGSGQDVMGAVCNGARGHDDASDALRHVGAVTLDGGGAQGGPDEAFGDVRIGGIESAQIGVRLPLFEEQLDLPAQPIAITDMFSAERIGREVGR